MSWVKLEKGNDWGRVYYAPAGKVLTRGGFATTRNGVGFPPRIRVRFNDGHEETVSTVTKSESCHVERDTVRYNLYGFTIEYHGVKGWVDFEDVEVASEDLVMP